MTTIQSNPIKIQSKQTLLACFLLKTALPQSDNNNRTYFKLEEAPEAELSNTASDVVPANTLAPMRAAKPVARKAPICLDGKKIRRPKKSNFHQTNLSV